MVDCERVSLGSSCAKLPHSHSAEISKTPPPGAGKNAGKMLALRVHMLDDNVTLFQVQAKALGRVLFDQVCKQLNLLEADYFGLEYQDHSGTKYWLDVEKPLARQVGLSLVEPLLHFCVKFYTPDPAQLEEEYTRYLFCLQIKRDLAQGHIQCNDNTAALMASYIVQAECGDYVAEDYPDSSYLSSYKFVQHQDRDLQNKIMENHKKHAGQSPAEADLNLLETARRCELYGMKMHSVKDHEGVPLNLAVAHMGIVVFQSYTKIYTFSWAKIRKISFKRKKFLIKLHPDGYGYYKDIVEFFFESRNECKNLWKKCVENHGFFRCNAVKRMPRSRTRVLSRGSSFRYSGKTQKQMVEFVRENYVKRQNFQRSQSFRQSSSVHSSVATNVGGSISAHPLIPLGDNSIVSASCGSMVLAGVDSPSRISPVDRMNLNHSSPLTFRDQRQRTGLHHSYKKYSTTSSQTDIVDFVEQLESEPEIHTPVFTWHRSASCKELHKALESVEVEKPQPKYERNFLITSSKTPSLDRTGVEQDTKVYSSSYPGTTSSLSTESADELEPGGSVLVMDTGSSREFSHDDLSHDSYELLEREVRSYVHSRSCSLGSSEVLPDDEIFVIEDFKDDVEKRLGYVEPRYRDIGFNEFNEKCKENIRKSREKMMENADFDEYEAKCKPGAVIGYEENERYPVERTKSEPFVSDFWRVARQHRKLFHQKSFDYTPPESMDSDSRSLASKSSVDIPYTLIKRNQMNGTANIYECRSPVSPRKSPEKKTTVEIERKRSIKTKTRLSKTKQDADLNSQDSGLSLSLGAESVDDLMDQNSKNNVVIGKSELKPAITIKKDLLKVRSEDGPRTKGVLVKSKALSADSDLRKTSSFERNPPVEVIKIDSQDGEGIVICSSDDKNISIDSSDPDVIIVEYKSSRKRAFQKRGSSDSKSSFEGRKVSSFDSQSTNRSDSDTSYRRDKYRDWKSESSSSCDLPERSDFRRERFSKEIKTSIEGKVVRETKEDREIKKQRSEELERQKVEKLIKSKSESMDRSNRQTSLDLKRSLLDMAGRSHGFCTCEHEEKKQLDKKGKSMDVLIENKDEPSGILKPDYLKPPERTFMANVTTVKAEVNPIKENVGKNRLEHMKRTEIYSDAENDDVFLETKKPDDLSEKDESTRLRKDIIILDSGIDLKNAIQICNERKKDILRSPTNKFEASFKENKGATNEKDKKDLKNELKTSSFTVHKEPSFAENIKDEKSIRKDKPLSPVEIKKPDHYSKKLDLSSKVDFDTKIDKKEIDIAINITETDKKISYTEIKNIDDLIRKPNVKPNIENSKDLKEAKLEKVDIGKQVTSPEMVWKKFGDLPPILDKRERSPILFARLGFSEGSAFAPAKSQSPVNSRRAKSLDAPVVSLHRLPPITSFSSKDDTVDNDEGIELEEKSLRSIKSIQRENIIEEEDASHLSPVTPKSTTIPSIFHESNFKLESVGLQKHTEELSSTNSIVSQDLISKNDNIQNLPSPSRTPEVPLSPTFAPDVPISPTIRSLKRSLEPAPLVINNDKVPSESVNTDDDTKSSPCTVAEISPDFNKTSPEKSSLNTSDSGDPDQALPELKKLHSHLLFEMDKLSSASDEQKVPDADGFEFDSPRKPSENGDHFENDVFECTVNDKDTVNIDMNVPCVLEITQDTSESAPDENISDDNYLVIGAKDDGSLKGLSPDVSRKSSASDISRKSSASDISRRASNASNPSRRASNASNASRKASDSEAYDGEVASSERRPSTRQERLDSFKNTKSYSVEIWTSEETEGPGIPTVDIEDVDWENDDDAFAPDPIEVLKDHLSPKETTFPDQDREFFDEKILVIEETEGNIDQSVVSSEDNFEECEDQTSNVNTPQSVEDKIPEISAPVLEQENNFPLEEIIPLSELCEKIEEPTQLDIKLIPPKRSFDEDVSSSSSIKPEKSTWKPFSLESSGSSSLEEGIFPPDDSSHFADEEEGSSNSAKDEYQGFGYSVVGAETIIGGGYSGAGGIFGLSRTLSRISERSTTSEQERSDFEDDISTKPSSRSLSVEDESLMSSDRQPSLSSDPSTNPEIEEHPLPPLPPEPLGFKIPPPLLNPEDEWPSPPNSSFETPIISNVESYYMDMKPEEATKVVIPRDIKPQYDSSSDSDYENKTLQDDAQESSTVETTVKLAVKKRQGNSSDTSLGVSDFSSSTSTVKHLYYSCTGKSDDSSLADIGYSLSTEMLASSRKNSDDSVCLRRRSYHAHQRSFDDYDSPYSESDESSRHNRRGYMNLPSPTSGGSGSLTPRKGAKQERRKEDRRPGVKSIARSKCYSYYSLARSPPSDGSSSSLELGEPPTTPNTIPRVSKRRRHIPPSKRRHRASADIDMRDGHLISVSSPSVVACGKCQGRAEANRSQMSKQSSV